MQCGSKCFIVEVEIDGKIIQQSVNARTSTNARKVIRAEYGKDIAIISAKEEKK